MKTKQSTRKSACVACDEYVALLYLTVKRFAYLAIESVSGVLVELHVFLRF